MYSRTEYDIYLKTDRGFIKPQKFDGIVWLEENEVFVIVANKTGSWIERSAGFV